MSASNDAYWDELGIAWRAVNSDPSVVIPRLGRRLRWQSACFNAFTLTGTPLSAGGLLLGAYTIWIGWSGGAWNFVTRGVAIIAVSLLLAYGLWSMRAGARAETGSLAGMIDLAILRAERSLRLAQLGYWACVVSASFGLLGYFIRVHLGRPPALSPFVPLVVLAVIAAGLFLFRRRAADELARFGYLRRVLADPAS